MFTTLENTWDRSARRGWSTFASFGFQAMALSLLLVAPLIWVQGPPALQFFRQLALPVPQGPPAPTPPPTREQTTASASNFVGTHLIPPRYIPRFVPDIHDPGPITPPDLPTGWVPGGTGTGGHNTVIDGLGSVTPIVPKAPLVSSHPIRISHWSDVSLIYRVQPAYPAIARAAHIQGPVQLRAIISRAGAIENLTAISGHPMLVPSAIAAVRQWRYRPYLLNDEPYEVETEITVNFVLAGN